jgi:hypothetical protein
VRLRQAGDVRHLLRRLVGEQGELVLDGVDDAADLSGPDQIWDAVVATLQALSAKLGDPFTLFLIAIVPVTVGGIGVTLAVWGAGQSLVDRRHLRFFGAFAVTTAVLGLASIAASGGMSGWEGFAKKMALHRTTYNHWNIGVTSVVIAQFDPSGPREAALALRPPLLRSWLGNAYFFNETVAEKAGLIRLLQVIAAIAAWFAARRFDDALAFAFGFVMTYFLTAPTYYYYIILLLPFLFFAAHPDRLRGTLGLVYLFLFGALGFTFYFHWDQYFTTYYWNSVLALGVTIAMVGASFGRFVPWSIPGLPARKR